jgi:hypothetical protein
LPSIPRLFLDKSGIPGIGYERVKQKSRPGGRLFCILASLPSPTKRAENPHPESLTEKAVNIFRPFPSAWNVSLFRHGRACPGHPRLSAAISLRRGWPE